MKNNASTNGTPNVTAYIAAGVILNAAKLLHRFGFPIHTACELLRSAMVNCYNAPAAPSSEHRLSKTEEADLRPAGCITITQKPGELATAKADTFGSGLTAGETA